MKDFEILPHTADTKIRVYGETLSVLFRNALIGMFQSVRPSAAGCTTENERLVCPNLPQKRNVTLTATDYETLLIDFLSEALTFSDIYHEIYLDVTIHELSPTIIRATLHGTSFERFEATEIKAVTHHSMHLQEMGGIWQTDIVFDI